MAHAIVMAVLAVLAQAAAPADKGNDDLKKLEPARRLLQNGRYAEADEAFNAVESEARKQPGACRPS